MTAPPALALCPVPYAASRGLQDALLLLLLLLPIIIPACINTGSSLAIRGVAVSALSLPPRLAYYGYPHCDYVPWLTGKISIFYPRLAGNNIRAVSVRAGTSSLGAHRGAINWYLCCFPPPIAAGSMPVPHFVMHAVGIVKASKPLLSSMTRKVRFQQCWTSSDLYTTDNNQHCPY